MQDIFRKITELVKNNINKINDNHVKFSDNNYKTFNFDKKNFYTIENIGKNSKIAFVDGGSAEILKSSNFSLNLIRIYYSIFQSNKRISSEKKDFYAFVYVKDIDGELFYDTEFISAENKVFLDKNDVLLSSLDQTIKQGITRANISSVASIIRRFSEIKFAAEIANHLDKEDIIMLDGSLQCTFTNEKKYFDDLYKNALSKNVIVCALSKTTTLMTDKGNSIANALNKFNVEGKWIYHPVADIKSMVHKADMAFVKLHEKSKYIFRFEIYKEQKSQLFDVVRLLAENCEDPVFIGYPYGLVEADRNARISNNEREMMLTYLMVKVGKDWEKIRESLSNVNAHELLDRIN